VLTHDDRARSTQRVPENGCSRKRDSSAVPVLSVLPHYRWHLSDVQRATKLRKPTAQPQPVWFNAFN